MSSRDEFTLKSFRFIVAGGISTTTLYLFYVGLVYAGVPYNVALALEYAVGITASYFWQRHWTFAGHGRPHLGFIKYCTTFIFIFALNAALLNVLVRVVGLGPVPGQLVALAMVTVASFLLQNFWVFRPRPANQALRPDQSVAERPRR